MNILKMLKDCCDRAREEYLAKIGWDEEDKKFVSLMAESGKESINNIDFLNEPTKSFINGCRFTAGLFIVFVGENIYEKLAGLCICIYGALQAMAAKKRRINEARFIDILKSRSVLSDNLENQNEGA